MRGLWRKMTHVVTRGVRLAACAAGTGQMNAFDPSSGSDSQANLVPGKSGVVVGLASRQGRSTSGVGLAADMLTMHPRAVNVCPSNKRYEEEDSGCTREHYVEFGYRIKRA